MPDGMDTQTTKRLVIDAMAAGVPWDVARQRAKAPISRATAFRWQARFRTAGDAVFQEQRHGHAWLVTPPVQDWIAAYCQAHPHTPSHALKILLAAELDCTVSVTQLNRIRARLKVTYQRPRHEKKDPVSPQP